MTDRPVLTRARADVAAGDLATARLRLTSALRQREDAEVRAALVEVCRRAGDPAAAGRFRYVTDLVTPGEVDAFARRHGGHPVAMLQALGPPHRRISGSAVADDRLDDLKHLARQVELEEGRPGPRTPEERAAALRSDRRHETLGCLGFATLALVLLALLVLGTVQAVRLLAGLV